MGARSASSKLGRGREVVPIIDDDGNDTGYSPLDKPNRRHSSHAAPRRRMLLTRGWLGFFLLLNIFAIAAFIFSSAWYFPATSTTGVVEQAIKQGDLSLLEIPARKDPQDNGVAEPRETAEATTTKPVATAEEATLTSEPPHQPPFEEPTTRLSSEIKSPTDNLNPVATAAVVATTSLPPSAPAQTSPDQVAPVSSEATMTEPANVIVENGIDRHAVVGIEAEQPLETTPPPTSETTTPSMSVVRSHSMEELLRRMKGTQPPSVLPTDREQATPAPAMKQDDELVQEDTQTAATGMLDEEYLPEDTRAALSEDEGLETNLVVWLKADAGVEVANAAECEALGTACEVASWKSVVPPGSGSDPIMFKPVNSRMQPVLQPASENDLSTVSFSCGMTHTNGFQLHDMMTLFFVLSPSQIEAGDTYAAQKFFGNAPYGQFLMHGGRPSFFTASGLVESSVSVKNDQLVLVAYRLHRHAVEIKLGDLAWSPKQAEADGFQLRLSGNAALSLGNVKAVCDTNAFQGRIAEVLIYDAVLSDHRVDIVERYLMQKWWGTTPPPRDEKPEGDDTKHPRMDSKESVVQPTKDALANPETEAAPISHEPIDSKQPEMSDQPRSEETDQPRLEGTDQPLEESQTTNPRAFDSEGVFEWLPSPELLALMAKEQGSDPSPLVDKWKLAVSEKIASVRRFQFGSDILRSFIRERRDELLKLREELFGG